MRTRTFAVLVGVSLLTLTGGSIAWGWPSSRLSEMAARQDLHDLVCIATSDGHITGPHRAMVLDQARSILPPDEFRSFKRALDRIPPPGKSAPDQRVAIVPLRPIPDAQPHKAPKSHSAQPKSAQRKPPEDLRAHAHSSAKSKKAPKKSTKTSANQKPSPTYVAAKHKSSPTKVAAKQRSPGVRNIAPPPKRSAKPAQKRAPATEPKPAAEPEEGPNLVVPVSALLPDRMVPSSIAR
jgi:hypothetical protein